MKPKNDFQEEYFLCITTLAFYQRRWVFVPMFYVPTRAYDPISGYLKFFEIRFLEEEDKQLLDTSPKRKTRDLTSVIEKKSALAKETLIPWSLSEKVLKDVCRKNGIQIGWVKKDPDKKAQSSIGIIRRLERKERKNKPLSLEEYRKVRKVMRKIFPQSALICEILWYVNETFKVGTYLTLEEVVRLMVEKVAPEDDSFLNWVDFDRDTPSYGQSLSTYLPETLWKRLCSQIKEDSLFVFSTASGGPVTSMQVEKHIKKAAKTAKIQRSVTGISFRPSFDEELRKMELRSRNNSEFKPYLEPVSEEEWKLICKEFPEIIKRRGRMPSYDPRVILNALLQRTKAKISLAKVSSRLTPLEVLKSQERRWRKNGLLQKILDFRKLNHSS